MRGFTTLAVVIFLALAIRFGAALAAIFGAETAGFATGLDSALGAIALGAVATATTTGATTGFVSITGTTTTVSVAALVSISCALSAGTVATVGLHQSYVAVHNKHLIRQLQALFVQCTKLTMSRSKLHP
jgi:hypothetical protein